MYIQHPFAVVEAHWLGLSDPRNGRGGAPDRVARWTLYGVPTIVLALGLLLGWD